MTPDPRVEGLLARYARAEAMIRQLQGKRWDSGWVSEQATTNHHRSLTHGLTIDLATVLPRLTCWFSPTDPAAATPAFIAPKSLRGMHVDDTLGVGQGYDNPAKVALWPATLELSFYSAMPLHAIFDPTTGSWTLYQTGWLRFVLTIA